MNTKLSRYWYLRTDSHILGLRHRKAMVFLLLSNYKSLEIHATGDLYLSWINTFGYSTQVPRWMLHIYARLKNGRIMPWQCPSVCRSVRPSVRPSDCFQHGLGYQLENWYIHWVGGTTCRVWASSQLPTDYWPGVTLTYFTVKSSSNPFLQSRPD